MSRKTNNVKPVHAPYMKFKGFMAANGFNGRNIAKALDLTPGAVYSKINGDSDFSLQEFRKLKDLGADISLFVD